jgi:hypothetical protein
MIRPMVHLAVKRTLRVKLILVVFQKQRDF